MSRPDWHGDPCAENAKLVLQLLEAAPDLAGSYTEHLSNYDELLPYVYLPDVVRALELMLHQGTLGENARVNVAKAIEAAITEGGSVRNLALLGPVEEIANAHLMSAMRGQFSLLDCMRDAFGPRTRKALSDVLDGSPFLSTKPRVD